MSTLRWLGAALALTVASAPADSPHFAPAEKSSLVKTLTSDTKLDSVEMKFSMDGRDLPKEALGDPKMTFHEHKKIVVTDRYVKVAGGRPIELERNYDELAQTTSDGGKMPGQTEEKVTDKTETSDLEGVLVRFTWKPAKEAYEPSFAGKDLDAHLLEGLSEDLDFRKLLPTEAVNAGDSWDLDGPCFTALLSTGGTLHFHEQGKEEKKENSGMTTQFEDNLIGTGKATFEKVRETEGRKLAVIAIEAKLKSHGHDEQADLDGQIGLDVEGHMLWDLAANRIDSLDLTGDMQVVASGDKKVDRGGEEHTLHLEFHLEGKVTLEVGTKVP